jgi:hypothetical protein
MYEYFRNIYGWKGIQEMLRKIMSTKTYVRNGATIEYG